jgi:hypothetical protein
MWKEVEIHGKPGNICAVFKKSPFHNGLPTKGLAWGPFDKDGMFKLLADTDEQEEVAIFEFEPSVAKTLEANWHVNTEN